MVRILRDQTGNISTPLLIVVGGVSLLLAHSEMKNINMRVDQVREESQRNFLGQQNISSLQMAARLLVGDSPTNPAPVHLDPYIPTGTCDQGRKLTAGNGGNWQSTADSITIQGMTQNLLQKQGDEVFNRLSQGQKPNLTADVNTPLKILGWKCSDTHAFLMEGIYVEAAVSQQNVGDKVAKTKALLAMAAPPPSSCRFYGKDSTGKLYPDNQQPTAEPVLAVPLDTLDLYLDCNNVVTDAVILNGGVKIAGTNSYPLTAANRIDPAFKQLLGPVVLNQGSHTLQALIEQVDGSKISIEMSLQLAAPPPPGADPNICADKCVTLPGEIYPAFCDNRMAHKDYYQDKNPKVYVCYNCDEYWGFDPNNDCKMMKDSVADRGEEGCFAGDTRIQLENGRDIAIEDLRPGDRIWNPILKKGMDVEHVTAGLETMPLYRVEQNGNVVRVTRDHPFVTQIGVVAAKDLRPGDFIQTKEGGWAPVKSVLKENQGYGKKVWNFRIVSDSPTEQAHMLVANGMVTGDLYLQVRGISRGLLEMISMEQAEKP